MTEHRDDIALDTLFRTARDNAPEPGADFLARLAADADAHCPDPLTVARPAEVAPPRRTLFERWATALVFATTAAAGVVIGVALPETLEVPGLSISGPTAEVSGFLPGYGIALLDEEG